MRLAIGCVGAVLAAMTAGAPGNAGATSDTGSAEVRRVVVAAAPASRGQLAAEIGLLVASPHVCAPGAVRVFEYEGSILGSFGIDKAVSWLFVDVDASRCRPDARMHEQRVSLRWERRRDTPWT